MSVIERRAGGEVECRTCDVLERGSVGEIEDRSCYHLDDEHLDRMHSDGNGRAETQVVTNEDWKSG